MVEKEEIFRYMKTIGYQDGDITSVAIFPSGAFLSISRRGILYKWNKLFNGKLILQIKKMNQLFVIIKLKQNYINLIFFNAVLKKIN